MNIRLIIVVAACFATGIGAGATWSVKSSASTTPIAGDTEATADSLATHEDPPPSDSSAADEHSADPVGAAEDPGSPVDTTRVEDADPPPPDTALAQDPGEDAVMDAATRPVDEEVVIGGDPIQVDTAAADTVPGRPSRIFGSMRPEEAARIIGDLDDVAALKILLGLSDRKVAAILSYIKGERAVSLARALLNHERVR